MKDNQDHFNVLRSIKNKPDSSQRELADDLGFSLGKLNYCLKALKKKGLVKPWKIQTGNNPKVHGRKDWKMVGNYTVRCHVLVKSLQTFSKPFTIYAYCIINVLLQPDCIDSLNFYCK